MFILNDKSDYIVIDVETTGVDPEKNAIVQIACAVCDHYLVPRATKVFKLKPFDGAVIEPKALQVNGLTEIEIFGYPDAKDTLKDFNSWLFSRCHANPRFALWFAWGVGFDDQFMFATYKRAGVEFYARRTWICLRGLATYFSLMNASLTNTSEVQTKNVALFCKSLGLEFEGAQHNPLADVLNSIKVVQQSTAKMLSIISEQCKSPEPESLTEDEQAF